MVALGLGCGAPPTTLLLEIDKAPALTVTSLSVQVTLGSGAPGPAHPLAATTGPFPTAGTLILLLPDRADSVSVTLSARDDAAHQLSAQGTVTSIPHEQVRLTLSLPATTTPLPIAFRAAEGRGFAVSDPLTLALPAGVVAGDLLIAVLAVGSSGVANPILTAPSGWTLITQVDHPFGTEMVLYWQVANPASSPPIWTSDRPVGGAGFVLAYSGVDPNTPVDTQGGGDDPLPGNSYATPALMTRTLGAVLIATFAGHTPNTGLNQWIAPANTVARAAIDDAGNRTIMATELGGATPGVITSVTANTTLAQDYAVAHLLALRPAQH